MACLPLLSIASCGSEPSHEGGDAAPSADAHSSEDVTVDATAAEGGGGGDEATIVDAGTADDDGAAPPDVSNVCVPVTSCPPGVLCGRYTDPCSGTTFACGSPCTDGGICLPAPGNPTAQTCVAKPCAGLCGTVGFDSCGVPINCGGCSGGLACIGNECTAATPSDAGASGCMTLTCTPDSHTTLCGAISDGCGHRISCNCTGGQECIAGVCAAVPPECFLGDGGVASSDGSAPADGGGGDYKCGQAMNACGSGTIACPGECHGTTKCDTTTGMCESCTPPSCGTATCGTVSNGCSAVSCGTCTTRGEVCGTDGGCCMPRTCADATDAGIVTGCGVIDLGCGVKTPCLNCENNERCVSNACVPCQTLTCVDFDGGCGHTDTCGDTINCCAPGTFCQGKICCPAGFVQYNGTCCQPGCDENQPFGIQMSCGQAIYCPPL